MKNKKFRKMALFLLSVGITGTLYLGLLYALQNLFHLGPYVSVSIAYGLAMVFYFLSNRQVVFQSTGRNIYLQVGGFILVIVFNYFLTLLIVWSIQRRTHEVYTGTIIAGIVTTIIAYVAFDRVLFKKKE